MSAVGDKNLLTKALSEEKSSSDPRSFRSGKECDKYPVVFLFLFTPPRNKAKAVTTNGFFQAQLKKGNLALVLWCVITHP
jgi:hypothetical protein